MTSNFWRPWLAAIVASAATISAPVAAGRPASVATDAARLAEQLGVELAEPETVDLSTVLGASDAPRVRPPEPRFELGSTEAIETGVGRSGPLTEAVSIRAIVGSTAILGDRPVVATPFEAGGQVRIFNESTGLSATLPAVRSTEAGAGSEVALLSPAAARLLGVEREARLLVAPAADAPIEAPAAPGSATTDAPSPWDRQPARLDDALSRGEIDIGE